MSQEADRGLVFLWYVRKGVANAISFNAGKPEDRPQGRPLVELQVQSVRQIVDGAETRSAPETHSLRMYGPGDVLGINPALIIRTDPVSETGDFEPNFFPLIEFSEPDLPWLFTPAPVGPDSIHPWVCLVTVPVGPGVSLEAAQPLPVLQCPRKELPNLDEASAWAHAQVIYPPTPEEKDADPVKNSLTRYPERVRSRLLSPRRLDPMREYIACVVPTYEIGRKAGLGEPFTSDDEMQFPPAPAWLYRPDAEIVRLPVYYHWKFRTGDDGDFETLVERLVQRALPPSVGAREMALTPDSTLRWLPQATKVSLEGALRSIEMQSTELSGENKRQFEQEITTRLNEASRLTALGRPEVGPPIYGSIYVDPDKLAASQDKPTPNITISISDTAFAPSAVTIIAGTQISWTNIGKKRHGVRARGSNGFPVVPDLEPGQSYSLPAKDNFSVAGIYEYLDPHSGSQGTIMVTSSGTAAVAIPSPEDQVLIWLRQLNVDPRARAAAGFGTVLVQEEQESLMEVAWTQLGDIRRVNQALQQAQLSRQVGIMTRKQHLRVLGTTGGYGHVTRVVSPLAEVVEPAGAGRKYNYIAGGRLSSASEAASKLGDLVRASQVPDGAVSPTFRRILRPSGPFAARFAAAYHSPNGRTGLASPPGLLLRAVVGVDPVADLDPPKDPVTNVSPRVVVRPPAPPPETPPAPPPPPPPQDIDNRPDHIKKGVAEFLQHLASIEGKPHDWEQGLRLEEMLVRQKQTISTRVQDETLNAILTQPVYNRLKSILTVDGILPSDGSPAALSDDALKGGLTKLFSDDKRLFTDNKELFPVDPPRLPGGDTVLPGGDTVLPGGDTVLPGGDTVLPAPGALNNDPSFDEVYRRIVENPKYKAYQSLVSQPVPDDLLRPLDPEETAKDRIAERIWKGDPRKKRALDWNLEEEMTKGERPFLERHDPLSPISSNPEFLEPMYEGLRDLSPDLLLPHVDEVLPNTMSMLLTNWHFVESFMMGLNSEMSRELIWREFPTQGRGVYFPRFWNWIQGSDTSKKDFLPTEWPLNRDLGPDDSKEGKDTVVLLIRGDLLRRYPTATIYAAEAKPAPTLNPDGTELIQDGKKVVGGRRPGTDWASMQMPQFRGTIEPDITFFGFNLTLQQVIGARAALGVPLEDGGGAKDLGYFFVIQQQPSEPRFGLDDEEGKFGRDFEKEVRMWSELSWGDIIVNRQDLAKNRAALSNISYLSLNGERLNRDPAPPTQRISLPREEKDQSWTWGANSAHMAMITLREPKRYAIHASQFLARRVTCKVKDSSNNITGIGGTYDSGRGWLVKQADAIPKLKDRQVTYYIHDPDLSSEEAERRPIWLAVSGTSPNEFLTLEVPAGHKPISLLDLPDCPPEVQQ